MVGLEILSLEELRQISQFQDVFFYKSCDLNAGFLRLPSLLAAILKLNHGAVIDSLMYCS